MLIPLETVIARLSFATQERRISREDAKLLVGEIVSSVYNQRISKMFVRMSVKKQRAIDQVEDLI